MTPPPLIGGDVEYTTPLISSPPTVVINDHPLHSFVYFRTMPKTM